MNKSLQLFFAGVVFLVSGAIGFVLENILLENDKEVVEVLVEEEETVVVQELPSTIPCILPGSVTTPGRDGNGNFSFSVKAEVESGHQLKYALYKDAACAELVSENLSGSFTNVLPLSSKTYYLRVQNLGTGDWSDVIPVTGFVELQMYQKITKAELENLINVQKDYSMTPKDFKYRIAPSFAIVANGVNENERGVSDLADICMKTYNGVWTSVVIENITYDRQNRLQKLTIRVNY